VSWGKRAQQLSNTVVAGARTVLSFVLSVPSRVRGFIALSSGERRKVYAGWWAVVKKEARHYWVGFWYS
jgi:fructose-bisphosphate aldolase class 1